MRISYVDAKERESQRTIWPIALAYYVGVTLLGAWCELRGGFRHFRADRFRAAEMLEDRYDTAGGDLMRHWFELQRERTLDH